MSLAIIEEEECLKSMRLKKPIPVVEKGNEIINVASFNNDEMLNLFIEALKDYGIKVNEAVENEVEVDEKSFFE